MALRVFSSIADAKRENFEIYDRAPVVILMRRKNAQGQIVELAAVQLNASPKPNP